MKRPKRLRRPSFLQRLQFTPVSMVLLVMVFLLSIVVYLEGQLLLTHEKLQLGDSTHNLRQMVMGAYGALFAPPVIDAPGERVYLPELRITVPLTAASRHLMYSDSSTDEYEALSITTRNTITTTAPFAAVQPGQMPPNLHCVNMLKISTKEADLDQYLPPEQVQLANGKTLYIYAAAPDACEEFFDAPTQQELAGVFKQAKPY